MKRKVTRLTENDLHRIVRKVVMESIFDDANNEFDEIREYYGDNKDELIDRLWYFINSCGESKNFIDYMNTSANYESYNDEEI
jgi:hypothetical protein